MAIAIDQTIRIAADTGGAAVGGDAVHEVVVRHIVAVTEAAVGLASDPGGEGVPAAGNALVAGETGSHAGLGRPDIAASEVDGFVPEGLGGGWRGQEKRDEEEGKRRRESWKHD